MRGGGRRIFLGMLAPAILACASTPQAVQFSGVPAAPSAETSSSWPHPPVVTLVEMQELDRSPVEVREAEAAGAGVTGAEKVVAFVPSFHESLKLKVKAVPARLDGFNNSPRKELAAYRVQGFFLDPDDYVVPTTAPRCVPLEHWRERHPSASPTVHATRCVLVMYAFWLNGVTLPKPLYDEERFLTDARYAYHLANFNILTHLVDHHDNRTGNFLVSEKDDDRRVYAIDNGTTFGAFFFNWFYPPTFAWRNVLVPALPRATVKRLRGLQRKDLDALAVVVQLEADDAGILRIVAPGAPFDPEVGARLRETTVQFGLTRDEIDDVWARIQGLLADVDAGRLTVF